MRQTNNGSREGGAAAPRPGPLSRPVRRMLFALAVALASAAATEQALRHFVIMPAHERLELSLAARDFSGSAEKVFSVLRQCEQSARVWALDDDAAGFATAAPGYAGLSGSDPRLRALSAGDISMFAFFGPAADLVIAEGKPDTGVPSGDLGGFLLGKEEITGAVTAAVRRNEPSSGFMPVPGGSMAIAAAPIPGQEADAPAAGALLVGRLIERSQTAAMAGRGGLLFKIMPIGSSADAEHQNTGAPAGKDENGWQIRLTDSQILGRAGLPGLGGRAAEALLAAAPRSVRQQSQATASLVAAILYGGFFIVAGLVGARFHSEITGARRREEEIRRLVDERTEELRRERDLFEAGPVLTISWSASEGWPVLFVSKNVRAVLGHTAEDLTAPDFRFASLIHPEDLPRVAEEVAGHLAARRASFEQSYRLRAKTGGFRWFLDYTRAEFAADGSVLSLRGYLLDQTERVESQNALRKSANFVTALLDAIPTPAFYKDRQGRYLGCNRAFTEFTGAAPEEIRGKTVLELWPGALSEICHRKDLELMESARHQIYEFKVRDKLGQERPVIFAKDVFRDERGEVAGLVGAFLDISEQKRAEAEKERAEERLRHSQRMEAVGQLAGGVAHDFNNLLQVINGFCELALAKCAGQSGLAADLRQIAKAGSSAARLVRQLLAFSRRQTLEMRPLGLNRLVEDHLEMLRRLIGEHISLSFRPAPDLPLVLADSAQIEQVLANLCINARDAMPAGGEIAISTSFAVLDESFCAPRPWAVPGRFVRVSVKDAGTGMDAATLAHIFDPFFTTKGIGKGTGLGLATVFGIVKQHGGLIDVASEPGRGTEFQIFIPETDKAPAGRPQNEETSPPATGTGTILLAEDEELVLDLTRSILESAGYRVIAAKDGAEAMALFDAHRDEISLAVLDFIMPEAGGCAVLEHISASRPETGVIFASGYGTETLREDYKLDHSVQILQKPFRRDDLLRLVAETLAKRRPARAAAPARAPA